MRIGEPARSCPVPGWAAVRLPATISDSGRSKTVEQYSVQLGTLFWEIDLFGRLRSLEASILEQYLATEQARVATHISILSYGLRFGRSSPPAAS